MKTSAIARCTPTDFAALNQRLRDARIGRVARGERAHDPGAPRGVAEAGEHGGAGEIRGSSSAKRRALAVERMANVQRAHQLDLGVPERAAREKILHHPQLFGAFALRVEPAKLPGKRDHAHAHFCARRVAGEDEVALPRRRIAGNLRERTRERRRPAVDLAERGHELLDALEVVAHLRAVAAQQAVDEGELILGGAPLVVEHAHFAPMLGARIGGTQSARERDVVVAERGKKAVIRAAGTDLGAGRGVEVAVDQHRRGGTHRRRRIEAVDRGHVGEQREDARARLAARGALELVDLQVVGRAHLVRIERVAGVEMPRDHERVALDAAVARRAQPVAPPGLEELDEAILAGREPPAERVLLVGGIDGDGADRLRGGDERRACGQQGERREDERDS